MSSVGQVSGVTQQAGKEFLGVVLIAQKETEKKEVSACDSLASKGDKAVRECKVAKQNHEQLQENLQRAMLLFSGVSVGNGVVGQEGKIQGTGLSDYAFLNIFINLVAGITEYTPLKDPGFSDPFPFLKTYQKEGVDSSPVIKRSIFSSLWGGKRPSSLNKALDKQRGELFIVNLSGCDTLSTGKQEIPVNCKTTDVVVLYRSGITYQVADFTKGKLTFDISFSDWLKENKDENIHIYAITPTTFGRFAQGKSETFMQNLKNSLESQKENQQTPPQPQ